MRTQLQRSLVRSHAAGTGAVRRDRGRARAHAAAPVHARDRAHRRARSRPPQAYADLLNARITPCVPEYGSLGCSGDLAPLAHCALAVMGEGVVVRRERRAEVRRRGARRGRPRRPSSSPRRRGSRSSTAPTACSACSRSRSPTCATLREGRRHLGGDERRGAARHRRGASRPTCRRCGRIPGRRPARAT